jgi:deoxycytidylate deaminase
MFVYGTYPVVSTDILFEILKKHSSDPLVQVVAIAIDPSTNSVVAFGVNKIITHFQKNPRVLAELAIDKNPAKKFLVRHAETDLIEKMRQTINIDKYEFIMSVQPCMACMSKLLDKNINSISYIKENRHQDEQELMKPFLSNIQYGKIEHKMVCVPPWIVTEAELEETIRNRRTLQEND